MRACAVTAACSIIICNNIIIHIYYVIYRRYTHAVQSRSDLNNRCSAVGCVGLERPEVGLKTNLVDVVGKKNYENNTTKNHVD